MESQLKDNLPQRLLRPLLLSVVAAIGVYAGTVILSDIKAVGSSIAKLGLSGWGIILGLSLVNYGLRFARWELYLQQLQSRIPVFQSLLYYLAGFAFTTTPGKAGEAVRSLYLKRHGVAYVHSLAAFFTERFVDLVAMILLSLLAALTFPDYQWPILAVTALMVALLPLIRARVFHSFLDRQIRRLRLGNIRTLGSRSLELLRSSSTLLRSGPLLIGAALALIAWGAEGVALYVILEKLEVGTSLTLAIGIYSVSVLVGALSFIPGGLGSTEAIMILLLKLIGADLPTAIAATLICRLATLWFAVVIGGFAMVAVEGKSRKSLNSSRIEKR